MSRKRMTTTRNASTYSRKGRKDISSARTKGVGITMPNGNLLSSHDINCLAAAGGRLDKIPALRDL